MKVAFGCDPNATDLKKYLMQEAKKAGYEVVDFPSDDPIYAHCCHQGGKLGGQT